MIIVDDIKTFENQIHQYVTLVGTGEELLIRQNGNPFAKMIPIDPQVREWRPFMGQVEVLPDDPKLQQDIENMFYGTDGVNDPTLSA